MFPMLFRIIKGLVPVVQSWIVLSTVLISIQWTVQLVSLILIHWIEIYLIESSIQLLNKWGQQVM